MSPRNSKDVHLVLGASPRVNLLPPEVADRKRGASIRRSVVFGVVGAVLISAAGYGLASWQALESGMRLDAAREETTSLLAEQAKFAEVRTLAQQKATIADALIVGASTEIDWKAYYEAIVGTLPAGVTLNGFVIDSSSPVDSLPVRTGPTQGARDAMVSLTITTPKLASVDVWLKALESLPGYVDATASGISSDENGFFTASVMMNISNSAFSNRFAAEGTTQPAETATDTATEEEGTN